MRITKLIYHFAVLKEKEVNDEDQKMRLRLQPKKLDSGTLVKKSYFFVTLSSYSPGQGSCSGVHALAGKSLC